MTDDAVNPADIAAPDANVALDEENAAAPSPAVVETDESDAPKAKGVQKRLDELTRNWRETERDRDHWRELAMRTQAPPSKTELFCR
jgi:hypothetical protein